MLPSAWIDRLFAKLTVRYGQAFMRQYADLDPSLVKADWGEVLAGFETHHEALRYAVENLPDAPPSAMQFRAIARRAPPPAALPAPSVQADPGRVAAALAAMVKARAEVPRKSMAQECIDGIEARCNGKPTPGQRHLVAHCLRMPNTRTNLRIEAASYE